MGLEHYSHFVRQNIICDPWVRVICNDGITMKFATWPSDHRSLHNSGSLDKRENCW